MKIVVLGGTQFMGRLTVEALLKAGHDVVMINRDRTANPFEGELNLRCVKCDRMANREGFKDALRQQGLVDVVIDFTGFQEAYLEDTLEGLSLTDTPDGKRKWSVKHYIFISTDSVYWAQRVPITDSRINEDDAQDYSPEEFERHMEYCNQTSLGEYQLRYGGNKLGCERVLDEAWREDCFPYTTLRLPDVYGPFDNLGGFWEIVMAIESRRPIPSRLSPGRIRLREGEAIESRPRRFMWVFAEDVRDAILAAAGKGSELHGLTLNIGHEEAVSLQETANLIAKAMNLGPSYTPRFDDKREAAMPSSDYGLLSVERALRLLRPWRPTSMSAAVQKSVAWFRDCKMHRRYHRLVHREARYYDETSARRFACTVSDVPSCWVGAPDKGALLQQGPAVLNDALPSLIGQAVLAFMQRLMDQSGECQVGCELQKLDEVERQTWALRYFAGHLLPQSEHNAAYRLENSEVLSKTDLLSDMDSPIEDIWPDKQPRTRVLRMGGAGARVPLQRHQGPGGVWDTALLGRRKWRLFPPDTPLSVLCVTDSSNESAADTFICGPDVAMVQLRLTGFAPTTCWECEQTMGDAVIVPNGWWYQTYDDDRTLSIMSTYGEARGHESTSHRVVASSARPAPTDRPNADEPEVIEFEFELVD